MKVLRTLVALILLSVAATGMAAENIYQKGANAYNSGDYAGSKALFEKVLASNPDDTYALSYVGACDLALKNVDEAIATLDRAAGMLDAEDEASLLVWVHDLRRGAFLQKGDTLSAIDALGCAIAIKPNEKYYYDARGTLYQNIHKNVEAIADFDKVLELDPENANAWVGKGYVYINMHNRDAAVDAFLVASKLDVANHEHWESIANDVKEMQFEAQNTEYSRDLSPDEDYELPVFVGGRNSFKTYLAEEVSKRIGKDYEGKRVLVDCFINEKGRVTEAKIIESLNDVADKIALDICLSLPVFRPAMYKGEPKACWLQVPVEF
ncbi:MAG: tetratricopeptide repeat protein [Muribaculaceae bacterium]|nr:tetratricopeptide repeat protein [Muribaculaceae bacterium]